MKQTAVDFLQDEILKDRMIKAKSIKEWNDVIDKARDMFQRQIIEAYATGSNDRLKSVINDYYNETYGSKGSAELGQSLEWDGEVTQGIDNHVPDVRKMVEISDEEIEKFTNEFAEKYSKVGITENEVSAFFTGMKWYREQLKQRQ